MINDRAAAGGRWAVQDLLRAKLHPSGLGWRSRDQVRRVQQQKMVAGADMQGACQEFAHCVML